MDSHFLFGATADHSAGIFELDQGAKGHGGSKKLSYDEAMALAADDAATQGGAWRKAHRAYVAALDAQKSEAES